MDESEEDNNIIKIKDLKETLKLKDNRHKMDENEEEGICTSTKKVTRRKEDQIDFTISNELNEINQNIGQIREKILKPRRPIPKKRTNKKSDVGFFLNPKMKNIK